MTGLAKKLFALAIVVTVFSVILWQVTGGDYYTKYEIVSRVEKAIDPSDPLAAAGFYEGSSIIETVKRNEFRFGLFPTPTGLFDKHIVSVVTFVGLSWGLVLITLLVARRNRKKPRIY